MKCSLQDVKKQAVEINPLEKGQENLQNMFHQYNTKTSSDKA